MASFVLTWNPDLFPLHESLYDELVSLTARGQAPLEDWSTGVRRGGISWGDRAFLLRQHRDRGIVASGEFTSEVFQGPHWDGSGREANYADVRWDAWLPVADRLPVEELQSQVPAMVWDRIQGSGVQLPTDASRRVEGLWEVHLEALGRETRRLPDEIRRSEAFVEGAVARVVVNRYERDPRARAACLAHWGTTAQSATSTSRAATARSARTTSTSTTCRSFPALAVTTRLTLCRISALSVRTVTPCSISNAPPSASPSCETGFAAESTMTSSDSA